VNENENHRHAQTEGYSSALGNKADSYSRDCLHNNQLRSHIDSHRSYLLCSRERFPEVLGSGAWERGADRNKELGSLSCPKWYIPCGALSVT
jgi:hypothetical protein